MASTTTLEGDAPILATSGNAASFFGGDTSVGSWLRTRDHKRVAIMYLVGVVVMLLASLVLTTVLRLEQLTPQVDILTATGGELAPDAAAAAGRALYNQLFTLSGSFLFYAFAIPAIPAALGNFLLPLMLGARGLAFPRVNLASFYLWLAGTAILSYAVLGGELDTGWTFYPPYSTQGTGTVIWANVGLAVLGLSSILTGLNFIVTIHKMRAPGVAWDRMPLFAWSLYATSVVMVLATPVFILTLLMLVFENLFAIGLFAPAMGGDPVLYQHFFWFYAHPATFIALLPALGLVSEIISVHSKKHIYGYKGLAIGLVATAVLAFLGWGQHMVVSGQSGFASALFSLFSFVVVVPMLMHVFSWVATLKGGAITLNAPMLYGLMSVATLALWILSGLFMSALSTNVHLHDSAFAEGHTQYLLYGGVVMTFLAGLHHWFPKMFGRMYDQRHAKIGAVAVFIGLNVMGLTNLVLGANGMAGSHAEYDAAFQPLQVVASIGAFVMVLGLLFALIVLVHGVYAGDRAPANPWGGVSLEWAAASPPVAENFIHTPNVDHDSYDFVEIDHEAVVSHH
ncbi:MAG: cytochrome c oxidase subunit I [Deltaproteobacteria bacterium]|nr:MAG: cytochrome c oxidase subunit I [Deltaproteobacteria bacterium]